MVGKGENAGNQHFLLFPQCFQKATFSGSLKFGLCGKEILMSVGKGENAGMHNLRNIYHLQMPLTLSQTTNFGLFQTERVCRRQFQI